MKKTILCVCFILNACILFAQTPVAQYKAGATSAETGKSSKISKKNDAYAMPATNDIITNISHSKELTTFYRAIQLVGLNETFSSNGPITIFAPDNQAFSNLLAGKLDTLLSPAHKYDLIALITYHAIAGKITAANIAHQINSHKGKATFITLTGSKLTAKFNEQHQVILMDENGGESIITRQDIHQANGLIHVVNSVLIPKFKNI